MRDGWKEISLEDLETSGVIKLGRGDVISKKDMEADPGPNPVYSSAENNNGMIGKYAKFMFDEELITWSVDGGGHIFYRPKHKFSVTNIGGWLRILDDKVFSYQFLTYALQRLHKQHSFDWQHKAHPSVIRKLYTRIPLPPLPEQKRIVDLISSVDSYVEALQQQLESAKRSRNAVLHELLTAGGDDWVETTLGNVCDFVNGDRGKNYPSAKFRQSHGIPFINAGHLDKGIVNFDSMDFISEEVFEKLGSGKVQPGDTLFCLRGSVGKFANVEDLQKGAIASSLVIIRPNSQITREFLMHYLDSDLCSSELKQSLTGAVQPNLSANNLKSFKISLPTLGKQIKIGDLLGQFNSLITAVSLLLESTRNLRFGILSDLLSGKHEIPANYDKVMGAA
jgi:type I restriction enzyme S subunit